MLRTIRGASCISLFIKYDAITGAIESTNIMWAANLESIERLRIVQYCSWRILAGETVVEKCNGYNGVRI
jgi:hypothetical protein